MRTTIALLLAVPLALAGCGTEDPEPPARAAVAPTTLKPTPTPDEQRYTATATVLEDATHGPQLCLGAVLDSLPPQCGGPEITNWDWAKVEAKESAGRATWGEYSVVGTYDGTSFTLTEQPGEPEPVVGDAPDFSTPCEPPEGGWRPVDPTRMTAEDRDAATAYVADQPDGAGLWVDQSVNAGSDVREVLNARFTGNLAHHEAELRDLWGGALCVSPAEHSEAELQAIIDELAGDPNLLGGRIDVTTNTVALDVTVDDGLQERLDREYGEGVVRVYPALRQVES